MTEPSPQSEPIGVPAPHAEGDTLARDREDYLTIKAVLADLQGEKKYFPATAQGMPPDISVDIKQLAQAKDAIRAGGQPDPSDPKHNDRLVASARAHGRWQEQVTWAEAENCSKLLGLIWSVRTADRIAEARDNADVRLMAAIFRKTLRDWYRVNEWPVDPVELKRWAQRTTRRYDAFPREWRGL